MVILPWSEASFLALVNTHTLRSRPLCCFRTETEIQFWVFPCPMLSFLGKHWYMNCNIYHKTELLHACSNMIHPWAVLGLHHRCMPICLGNQKVKTLGWRGEHDPRNEREQKFTVCIFIWLQWKSRRKKIIQSRKTNVSIAHGGQAGSSGQFCGNTQFISYFTIFSFTFFF